MAIPLNPPNFYGHQHHAEWFEDRKQIIKDMSSLISTSIRKLGLQKKDVSLVGTGMSGAMSVPLISHYSKIPFALIRHAGERTVIYNSKPLVGEARSKVIFIDDLIATSGTLCRVFRILKQHNLELVGAITLESYSDDKIVLSMKKEIPVWTLGC